MPKLTPAEGAEKLLKLIERNAPHAQHQENVKKATFWRSIMSGKRQEDIVTSFKPRESDVQKEQRISISHTPTPEAYEKAMANVDRIDRPDGLIQEIKYDKANEANRPILVGMLDGFNGTKGLDDYLQENFKRYASTDPNAFLFVGMTGERDAAGNWKEKPRPKPEIIPCEEVYEPELINGEYQSLTRLRTFYKKASTPSVVAQGVLPNAPLATNSEPYKVYTLYFTDYVIQATELTKTNTAADIVGDFEERTVMIDGKKTQYAFQTIPSMSGEVPFIEWGYLLDDDNESYVSILNPVETLFRQLINRSSELELNIACHAFLQKFMFTRACTNTEKGAGRCENGIMSVNKSTCAKCKGTGKQMHTTVQDVMMFDLPDSKDEYFPLSDMVHWPTMPFEIVDFLSAQIPAIHTNIESTLWGINVASPPQGDTLAPTTATEIIGRYDTVYKRLGKMAAHKARMWLKCVRLTAKYAEIEKGLDLRYTPPTSFQMETLQELLIMLDSAKKSGAPYPVIQALEKQILKKQGQVSGPEIAWHDAMHAFMPFKSKSASDISTILGTLPAADYYKVLWTYFDEIFEEIRQERPQFPLLPFPERKAIVKTKVDAFVELAKANEPQAAPLRETFNRLPVN